MLRNIIIVSGIILLLNVGCVEDTIKKHKRNIKSSNRIGEIESVDTSDPRNVALLISMLDTEEWRLAADKLIEYGPMVVPSLITAIDDEDKRSEVLWVIKQLGPELREQPLDTTLVNRLADLLKKEDGGNLRNYVAQVFMSLGTEASQFAVPFVVDEMKNLPNDYPLDYLILLGGLGPITVKDALDVIIMALNVDSDYMRSTAIDILIQNADKIPEIPAALQEAWKQGSYPAMRYSAIIALNKLGIESDTSVAETIIEVLETYSLEYIYSDYTESLIFTLVVPWYIRESICLLCNLYAGEFDMPAFMFDYVANAKGPLRQLIAFGLVNCQSEITWDLLAILINDETPEVRYACLFTLWLMGGYTYPQDIIQKVIELSRDDSLLINGSTYPIRELADRILELKEIEPSK